MSQFYVYILANQRKTVLYTGITNDLARRVWQHRRGLGGHFTSRYHCSRLVFYEVYQDSYNAITREKQIKAGSRSRKFELDSALICGSRLHSCDDSGNLPAPTKSHPYHVLWSSEDKI